MRYALHTAALKFLRVLLSPKLGMHVVFFWLMLAWVKLELSLRSKVSLHYHSLLTSTEIFNNLVK